MMCTPTRIHSVNPQLGRQFQVGDVLWYLWAAHKWILVRVIGLLDETWESKFFRCENMHGTDLGILSIDHLFYDIPDEKEEGEAEIQPRPWWSNDYG